MSLAEEIHLAKQMNKKGNLLGFGTWIIMFICVWTFWLGSFMQEWGLKNVTDNSLTGIEAMFYMNLNLWIFFGLIAVIYMGIKFGGGNS